MPARAHGEPMTDRSPGHRNEIVLVGRITSPPAPRVLPSGTPICSWRITVDRAGADGFDVVDCTAWTARTRRSAAAFGRGDVVEVTGALRRRFYRAGGGVASACDVEVRTARRLRRGGSAEGVTRPRRRE
jgi:single-strand DNA-binding protein